ncbi:MULTISPECIES: UDP-forming cellulose synthase catalytic subunit [Leptolyngbya]|uniref:UDP-forming cellulose synthase catalytic subunit n=1 Tax=Leptolyngbya TaxID=47251 RepID=UPI001683C29E|nr:UDP-forming cellulose synthase catalytic subunit [Leptolyngbya sp. FACHB-1624]MBD1855914.1 UDP-forming cellulose synthase catalytic subunit [Leptolyngbya sp. FACHB-1624]
MAQSSPTKGQRLLSVLADLIPNFFDRVLHWSGKTQLFFIITVLLFLSVPLIITPLKIWQQGVVAILLIAIGWAVSVIERKHATDRTSEYLHLFMIWLSLITTFRYLFYRVSYTLNLHNGWLDGTASILLFLAELYAIMTLVLSFFQTLKLKERQPIRLANLPQNEWLSVDVYIPTYSEDVEIVRKTALAAMALDYPTDKKQVYILDDGASEALRDRRFALIQMCQEIGCTLLTRENNDHAKAGNINAALTRTTGDLILILDADHIPLRSFLLETVGFFLNPKVALVQTPHWFYNPDPFERNLRTAGKVPVGNELFYKVLQKGNDFWNAAFFCGSAAVVRRSQLLEIGGIATETVTEDCHTSLRLHSSGYETVYYDKIMVAGLAPEKFSAYVGQQTRWARGMAQILRLENPLFNPRLNLTLPQRICYFSATSHFFFGFPRLMYAIAPILFLLFGLNPVRGLGLETLAYALPHFLLAAFANYIAYKHVRFSFWNEVYEFAMSFHTAIVTLLALLNPGLGKFNVTQKGLIVDQRSFDWRSTKVLLVIGVFVAVSILAVPFWIAWSPEKTEAVMVNLFWSLFNFTLIIAALLVGLEQPQQRAAHRLARNLRATIHDRGQAMQGVTLDISDSGARILLNQELDNLSPEIEIELMGDSNTYVSMRSQVIRLASTQDGQSIVLVNFLALSRAQRDALSLVIYSDVQEWYAQRRDSIDDLFTSFGFIAGSIGRSLRPRRSEITV